MNETDFHHAAKAAAAAHKAISQYAKKNRITPDFWLHVHAIGALICNTAAQIDDTEQASEFIQFLTDNLSAGLIELPVNVSLARTDCFHQEPSSELH